MERFEDEIESVAILQSSSRRNGRWRRRRNGVLSRSRRERFRNRIKVKKGETIIFICLILLRNEICSENGSSFISVYMCLDDAYQRCKIESLDEISVMLNFYILYVWWDIIITDSCIFFAREKPRYSNIFAPKSQMPHISALSPPSSIVFFISENSKHFFAWGWRICFDFLFTPKSCNFEAN